MHTLLLMWEPAPTPTATLPTVGLNVIRKQHQTDRARGLVLMIVV